MKMKIEALRVVWPNGIPTTDYERALLLAATVGGGAPVQHVVPEAPKPKRETKAHNHHAYASDDVVAKVREVLATGRATVEEIAETAGLSSGAVRAAVVKIGAVDAGRGTRRDGRHGKRPVLWALPKQRTP